MPGTLVGILAEFTAEFDDRSVGLRSYMSIWLGPPPCQMRMTDVSLGGRLDPEAAALSRR